MTELAIRDCSNLCCLTLNWKHSALTYLYVNIAFLPLGDVQEKKKKKQTTRKKVLVKK